MAPEGVRVINTIDDGCMEKSVTLQNHHLKAMHLKVSLRYLLFEALASRSDLHPHQWLWVQTQRSSGSQTFLHRLLAPGLPNLPECSKKAASVKIICDSFFCCAWA